MQLQCSCGKFQARLKAFPKNTPGRLICYCDDCQRYLHYLKRPDLLDINAGTEIIPAYPADMEIVKGIEELKCVRLSSKGMYRFYTSCCQSPVGNTSPNRAWVGILRNMYQADLDKILGPVRASIMGKYAKGTPPQGTPQKFDLKGFSVVMPFILKGALMRKANPSPFFQKDGATAVVLPHVINSILAFIVLGSVSAFALTPKGETVKKKAVETYVATKEYTIEQKNEFVTGLKSELSELDKDIAVMKTKASAKTDEASKEIKLQLESLEKKRAELNVKIDRLSTASKSAWTELRSGVQSAYKEMKSSFNKASEKFNEKK